MVNSVILMYEIVFKYSCLRVVHPRAFSEGPVLPYTRIFLVCVWDSAIACKTTR